MTQPRRLGDRLFPLRLIPNKLRRRFLRDVLRKEMAVASVMDFDMIVPLQISGIGHALLINGQRELDQYEILLQVLRSGSVVMDIGSNIGYYVAVEARLVGDSGYVYAFEPDPRNMEYLVRNITRSKLQSVVETFSCAVSNANGTVSFNLAVEANLNSIEKTRGANDPRLIARGMHQRKYLKQIDVKALDFCDFLENASRPVDLVRMDVEGYEVEILGSLLNKLENSARFSRAPAAIVFEPHCWEYNDNHSLRPVLEKLVEHGYRITHLGTRDESNSPIHRYGYSPFKTAYERRGVLRGIYRDVEQSDAIELASEVDGVTTVCLQRGSGVSRH